MKPKKRKRSESVIHNHLLRLYQVVTFCVEVIAALITLLSVLAGLAVVAIIVLFVTQDYSFKEEHTLEICYRFNLPAEDEFCKNPSGQNGISFEQALERNYPIKDTTLTDLQQLLRVDPEFSLEICDGVGSDTQDERNPSERCMDDFKSIYTIDLPVPATEFSIHFDENGLVIEYRYFSYNNC